MRSWRYTKQRSFFRGSISINDVDAEGWRIIGEEYLTIAEVSAFLKVKPKTIANKMSSGVLRKGVHYFSPAGMGPRFKRSALIQWMERGNEQEAPTEGDPIPMPRSRRARELKIGRRECMS